jgi:hypothetical protein
MTDQIMYFIYGMVLAAACIMLMKCALEREVSDGK